MINDNRKYARTSIKADGSLTIEDGEQSNVKHMVKFIDLSATGALVITSQFLKRNQKVSLAIESLAPFPSAIKLTGRVLRVSKLDSNEYKVAIQKQSV